jgi:hypothetical protein
MGCSGIVLLRMYQEVVGLGLGSALKGQLLKYRDYTHDRVLVRGLSLPRCEV